MRSINRKIKSTRRQILSINKLNNSTNTSGEEFRDNTKSHHGRFLIFAENNRFDQVSAFPVEHIFISPDMNIALIHENQNN